MNKDLFGFKAKKPPYRFTGVKNGNIQIEAVPENWEEYLSGDGYDKYFIYYRCSDDGRTWYQREIKPEWKNKITPDIEHMPLAKLEEYLKKQL